MIDVDKIAAEFSKNLIEMAENFQPTRYKEKALKELEEIKKLGKETSNIEQIINDYPDFDHIRVKCTMGDVASYVICVEPKMLLENRWAADELGALWAFWQAQKEDAEEIIEDENYAPKSEIN